MWDVENVRTAFPILAGSVYGRPLVYLDNAATTHKPQAVLDAIRDCHVRCNSNVHRSAHYLSSLASQAYEQARETVKEFIHAESAREIVFTSGTTESINLAAHCYCEPLLGAGEEIVISEMEHHSNLVPWQVLCQRRGASLKVMPVRDDGSLDVEQGEKLITDTTRLVAVAEVSNVLGSLNPVKRLIRKAHDCGAAVLVDGAQAVPHRRIDVRELDCDFYAFSAHKMYAETGTGVLYGKQELLEKMQPWLFGGGMIDSVDWESTTFAEPPYRFEAGTRHVAGAIGLAAAIGYLDSLGWDALAEHEQQVIRYAMDRLSQEERVTLYGTSWPKYGVVSFAVEGIQHLDAATMLDKMGIAVRSGHHCAQPLMKRFGIDGTVRASFACYNTRQEVDALLEGIGRLKQMLG